MLVPYKLFCIRVFAELGLVRAVASMDFSLLLSWSVLLLACPVLVTGLYPEKFVVQPHPVQFNEEPHDWIVTEGASVSLTCDTTVVRVIGYINEDTTPVPQIKWFHDDVMINSSGHFTINNHGIATSILTIRNVTSLEQGEYYCVVNEWVKPNGSWWTKTRSKSGHITVMDKSSVEVSSEEYVTLCCREETPSSGVVWMKDGVGISHGVINHNGDLLLRSVNEESSGYYQCINPADNTTLLTYHVTVNTNTNLTEKPQLLTEDNYVENHFITIRSDADIHGCINSPANQSVTLTCKAVGQQEISWYKNGELLDLNSEGTTFNQTTGDLVIRREDACDLLGVYQCFASNEIDTVHVSTRVLPFGWPNRPGKLELISHIAHTSGFILKLKLHKPDYLGGLDRDDVLYDIYIGDAVSLPGPRYLNTYNSSIDTIDIDLSSKVRILEIDSLGNTYYLTTQLVIKNKDLIGTAIVPSGSPLLVIRVLCDLVDFPPAIIEHTCTHDDASDMMVTYNISWRLEGSILNYVYADNIGLWEFSANCRYPNGTLSIQQISYYMTSNEKLLQVPRGTYCVITIAYDTQCLNGAPSSALLLCNTSSDHNNSEAPPTTSNSTKEDTKNNDLLTELLILSGVVSLMLVIIITIAIFICCVHFRQKKECKAGKNLAHVIQ